MKILNHMGIPDMNTMEKRQECKVDRSWDSPPSWGPTLVLDHRAIKMSQAHLPVSGKGVRGVAVKQEEVPSGKPQDWTARTKEVARTLGGLSCCTTMWD